MRVTGLEELIELLRKMPGVGVRQARRMAYHVMRAGAPYAMSLGKLMEDVAKSTVTCSQCHRLYESNDTDSHPVCGRCASSNTDRSCIMVVCRETDLEAVERTGVYPGRFFVLGALLPLTSRTRKDPLPTDQLRTVIRTGYDAGELRELVIALPVTAEGDATATMVREMVEGMHLDDFTVTELGRGVSTGTELEYIDTATLESAYRGRR